MAFISIRCSGAPNWRWKLNVYCYINFITITYYFIWGIGSWKLKLVALHTERSCKCECFPGKISLLIYKLVTLDRTWKLIFEIVKSHWLIIIITHHIIQYLINVYCYINFITITYYFIWGIGSWKLKLVAPHTERSCKMWVFEYNLAP
jgi:hypothetical protein